ncbi:Integral membrane protein [Schistosoma japonicum]|uniref:Integral membrane protein n=1 Tax=Schistosoma japonicum TaxID=6182 RepID=A0A4Z2DIM3_SCHJA|nr:Integral membrane protein [Schistosoma japonicum]
MENKRIFVDSALSTSTNSATNSRDAFDELIPVLVQCFGVILLGYIAGRLKVFSESQAKGLNFYVTKFALPTVFFRAMVTINLSGVCWFFVMAISVSKLIGFLMAIMFTFLISRRFHLGIAAIVAMFVSQSNDVALAYPILYALFPDLASYVYLFAPAQLVILNPFSYFLLELERVKSFNSELKPLIDDDDDDGSDKKQLINDKSSNSAPSSHKYRQLALVLFNVLKNPLFFMTVIGVIFNFILKHQLPLYVDGLLKVIADSFSATALFSLGYGMVGKMATITQREVYILTAILLTKLLVVPFITRELVVQMMPAAMQNETLRYSTFGFLYGSTPTAPPVYLFAAEYQVIPVAIGVGLVLGTFLCAPIMFIFARIITVYNAAPSDYAIILGKTAEDISWISIGCCIWTIGVLCFCRKITRVPNRFTLCHLICVLFSCSGVLLGRFVNQYYRTYEDSIGDKLSQPAHWLNYVQFAIFFFGCTGTRCWTTLVALVLVMERARSLCFVLRYQLHIYLVGFLTPIVVTFILLLTSSGQMVKDIDPVFQYGTNQLIMSIIVLIINAAGTLACLISFIRIDVPVQDCYEIKETSNMAAKICNERCHRICSLPDRDTTSQRRHSQQASPANSVITNSHRITGILARYCETHQNSMISSSSSSTSHPTTQQISLVLDLDNVRVQGNVKPPHHKHVIFLILILVTMFFGICLCTWRLVHEAPTGIYIVLEFLDGSFNFGQGVVLFVLFGLDTDLFIMPTKRFFSRWLNRFTGKHFIGSLGETPLQATIDNNIKIDRIVNQFVKFHLKSCSSNIGHAKVIDSIHYEQVFHQYALEKWLTDAGITDSNDETISYIECLELGNIITCISPFVTNESFINKDSITTALNPKRLLTFSDYAFDLHNMSY